VGSLIQLYDNGSTTVLGSTTVGADGTWTVTGLNLAAGTHNFTAKSTDAAGTVSTSSVAYNATVTPVVLDLNGDGQIGYSQIKMDLNRDGILDTTAWVAAQDGLLVHDIYGDGSVRENSQFAFARHGGETDLQGLAAQFDSNRDGVLDAKDTQFGEFAVWQDTDQDGVADAGELKTLVDLGITALQLNSDGVQRTPETGVTEAGRTTAQLANGSTLVVADAAFNYTLSTAEVSVIPAPEPGSTSSVIPASEPGSMPPDANTIDPGSSSGVTNAVIPASASVIPAPEPGSTSAVIPAPEPGSMPPDANTMDPGSSSGVTNAVIPAPEPGSTDAVIPAPEPGSISPMTLKVNSSGTTIDLASFVAQNANADITQVDLSGTGDNTLRLSLTDVLQQANANGQALQVDGNAGDVVELFTQGTAPVQTSTSINGHDYAAYDLDRNGSMDLLVDQAVRVSLS
jgi:hypothetical protein